MGRYKTCTAGLAAVLAVGLMMSTTVVNATVAGSSQGASGVNAQAAQRIMKGSNCLSCHAVHHQVVGPSFQAIAKRYANGGQQTVVRLVSHVKNGVNGIWSHIPMPPHPKLSKAQIRTVVQWILSQQSNGGGNASPAANKARQYSYKVDGKKVVLGFPVFRSAKDHYVTHRLFRGYELYNSYCFRCHGPDAMGGEYAPDLRKAVSANQGGLNEKRFITIAMEGRKAKGMPSWAGFFKEKEIEDIFRYVKARSMGLVSTGRPRTPQG